MKRSLASFGWLLLLPWIATFLIFWFFPLIYSFVLSLTNYRLLAADTRWVGLANYARLFGDPDFLKALANTAVFVIGTIPVTTIIALSLALLVNERFPGRAIFRAVYFLPSITSLVDIALIFSNPYARDGHLCLLARMVGMTPPETGFLLSEKTALLSIMAMDVWTACGYYMLIFLGGLQTIPEELYEAARITGATRWQQFRYVTLPMLRPVLLFVVVINSIKSFQIFTEIFVMTKGGPLNATLTGVYFVYETGLRRFDFGYASAAAYVIFLIIAALSLAQFKFLKTGWTA
ncbi:MAG: sugar ABC transporter permease [candidate division Zixibacteria bacterium]|nr:sugar ABC transporter permease [candidate division Zixibacteria bacterium]